MRQFRLVKYRLKVLSLSERYKRMIGIKRSDKKKIPMLNNIET